MKYKLNAQKILEVLEPYERGLFFDEDMDLNSNIDEDFLFLFNDDCIEDIKNKYLDSSYGMLYNFIIEKLNQHFNECFEEVKLKYSYDKCKKFLEDLGFEIGDAIVYEEYGTDTNTVSDEFDDIINALNDNLDGFFVYDSSDFIYTLLKNNKDKLLED